MRNKKKLFVRDMTLGPYYYDGDSSNHDPQNLVMLPGFMRKFILNNYPVPCPRYKVDLLIATERNIQAYRTSSEKEREKARFNNLSKKQQMALTMSMAMKKRNRRRQILKRFKAIDLKEERKRKAYWKNEF